MPGERLKGHLDGLLLAVLEAGPQHGYGVIQTLAARTDGTFDLPSGTVYPVLHRLMAAGLIEGEWSRVDGRRRLTYRLTDRGRRVLEEERGSWRSFAGAVSSLLGSPS
jgi:PadR family transcriptional regulator, regulatory protein PadR